MEAITDEAGRASFVLPADHAVRLAVMRGGGVAARIDVPGQAGSPTAPLCLSVLRHQSVVVRVRRNGVPTLPGAFVLTVDGQPLDVLETQPGEGLVIGTFELGDQRGPHMLALEEEGRPKIVAALPPEDGNHGVDVTLELAPAGPAVEVAIRPATGMGVTLLILQRWDATATAWGFDRFLKLQNGRDADGLVRTRLQGLAAGRYRLYETDSAHTSEEMEIVAGGPPLTVQLDLTGSGIARGRVEVPEGSGLSGGEIWLFDPANTTGDARSRGSLMPDGTFSVAVPGDREVRLEARHPQALPGAPGSSVTLREPRDGIVLHLSPAPTASVRLFDADRKPVRDYVTVILRRRDPGALPSQTMALTVDGETRFSGFAPGRYDVFLDQAPNAPLVLEDVELTMQSTFLGTHAFTSGRAIRLRALRPEGMPLVQGLGAFAELVDPSWHLLRGAGVTAAGEGRVSGLMPGRYRVRFLRNGGPLPPAAGVEHTVDVTEANEPEVTIDFRPVSRSEK